MKAAKPILLEKAGHSWVVQVDGVHRPEWLHTSPRSHQQLCGSRVQGDEVGDVVHPVLEGHPNLAGSLLSA